MVKHIHLLMITSDKRWWPEVAFILPSQLPKFGLRWPSRLISDRLSMQPQESLVQVPDHTQSTCSFLENGFSTLFAEQRQKSDFFSITEQN